MYQSTLRKYKAASVFLIIGCALGIAALLLSQQQGKLPTRPKSEHLSETDPLASMLTTSHGGDIDDIISRGSLRALVTTSRTHYFIEEGKQYGLSYELLSAFEKFLKTKYQKKIKGNSFHIVIIPVQRDEILTRLKEQKADIAVANPTITPERQAIVNFSSHMFKNVSEVIVTRTDTPPINTLDQLSGMAISVRPSSSFHKHLQNVNAELKRKALPPLSISAMDEHLETEDILQLVESGIIEATVADSHMADLWVKVYPTLYAHTGWPISEPQTIAWAIRKETPHLLKDINEFLQSSRAGTLLGNIVINRYLKQTRWAHQAHSHAKDEKFKRLQSLFNKYGEQYNLEPMLLMAQAFHESRFEHEQVSNKGAIGVMQLLPSTGKAMNVGDIRQLEPNVHAGVKYMRTLIDQYFDDPNIDKANRHLLALSAYNAGPTRIRKLRAKMLSSGKDPNKWFGNVETTVAKHVGPEPVNYVAKIAKLYVAYRLVQQTNSQAQGSSSPPSD